MTRRRRGVVASVLALAWVSASARARAEPLRLRADAISDARAPTGLLVLQGSDRSKPWVDAEALVWAGSRSESAADVLVLTLRVREPHGYGEARGGRFVMATGAIRPVHIDGASATARAPWGTTIEAFSGLAVVPRLAARKTDWVAGGRLAQSVASRATAGVSYVQRRSADGLMDEEVGADIAATPATWVDVAGRGSYDLVNPGVTEATASVAARGAGHGPAGWGASMRAFRLELFAVQRSPSRMLPATSLFSVLGDFPSRQAGSTLRWRAAPRLDLLASAAGQSVGGELGGNGWLRGTLKLDDRGDGSVGVELRRQAVSTARWTGLRLIATQPLGRGFRTSTELELARPDDRGRAAAWPWGLLALSWRARGWEVAAAVEAAATPEHRYELDVLARVARSLELTR